MAGTENLWTLYNEHITNAQFSLIAANLLLEEVQKGMSDEDLKDYYRRHRKHIRAVHQHVRQARKLRKTIARIERKANG